MLDSPLREVKNSDTKELSSTFANTIPLFRGAILPFSWGGLVNSPPSPFFGGGDYTPGFAPMLMTTSGHQ